MLINPIQPTWSSAEHTSVDLGVTNVNHLGDTNVEPVTKGNAVTNVEQVTRSVGLPSESAHHLRLEAITNARVLPVSPADLRDIVEDRNTTFRNTKCRHSTILCEI
jgi:hypothetical protein